MELAFVVVATGAVGRRIVEVGGRAERRLETHGSKKANSKRLNRK